ncbi:DNA protecting protein DprA [Leptothrix cholodnii SP-6]|uniref:DNA protecting protein DprA n=1 Tax=Leptothrix cholodnii (strain ATCC 51168 / LMG 8142 / SP-6) TaxID=395495 RepID=B1XW96_LEPCP|nr:DNA-processing protein DprA [Leptothrix cholodnii]ACB32623.1 DNA protecting protein DprA [Leptothrix cholodnii SP-6]
MDRDELAAWLQLLETPGVGRQSARRLLAAFGSPQAVLSASVSARAGVIDKATAAKLEQAPEGLALLVERTAAWLTGEPGRRILTLADPAYPSIWLNLPDPPLLLYAQGKLDLLQRPALAIVGSRHPTPEGTDNARAFAASLSRTGLTIVSGLAAGIDGAAHEGALGGTGSTIALVGTGLDRVYPRAHLKLAREIADRGLLLSEFSIGTPPLAAHFPLRNRLIAGLGMGTLVVEAALKSGSLITARLASEFGREVFAIPGSIHNPQSRGCHALIRQGAKLVESTQDVLEELHLAVPAAAVSTGPAHAEPAAEQPDDANPPPDDVDDPILLALGWSAATLDVLQARTGWATAELNVHLLDLELSGQVVRLPGQLFQRRAQA